MNSHTPPTDSSSPLPSNWLLNHRKIVYSQRGEDGILEKIFEILPELNRWCVEFGAADGKTFSNTCHLIQNKGWNSVQLEGNPKYYEMLLETHGQCDRVICLNQIVSFEGDNSLDNILQTTPIPKDFDFLCIDIDGNDYHIWDSLQVYRPKVVMIEFNPTIPHYVGHIQPRDTNVYHGSSLLAMQMLGREKDYELIASTEWNAFFVDKQYFPLFGIADNSIWKINQNYQFWTYVFQLYDGTVMVGGMNKLVWHHTEVDLEAIQEMVQVLPPEQRFYPGQLDQPANLFSRSTETDLAHE